MTFELQRLISEASQQLGSDACKAPAAMTGRASAEGRCPHPQEIGDVCACSQAVYECRVCGDTDYGERGGPGHADCMDCRHKWLADESAADFWRNA
ncbi:MAG TPA: hypothetical protein VLD59_08240 [Steroidobacteraceae bacterium]|nr:hypothetical protein [Steroidobacteraceae bacterium]